MLRGSCSGLVHIVWSLRATPEGSKTCIFIFKYTVQARHLVCDPACFTKMSDVIRRRNLSTAGDSVDDRARMTQISCFKMDTEKEENWGSAGRRGFIGQSFSYSLLRSSFRLTLISSASHVGPWAMSPWTNMRIQNMLSLLILSPQDTAVAFDSISLFANQYDLLMSFVQCFT